MKKHPTMHATKRIAFVQLLLFCLSLLNTAEAQNLYFAKGFSNASPLGGTIEGRDIALDAAGNRYVIGHFQSTADLDPGTGTQNLVSAGINDVFLAKYDASGNYVWAKSMGGSGSDLGYALALDASGNIYITGTFLGTVDFDPGTGIQNLISAGNTDIFLAKYDASGNYVWAKNMGGTNPDIGYALAVDGSGNCFITGSFSSTNADFDPGAGTQTLSTAGSNDIFLAKYDASGNYAWALRIGGGGPQPDIGYALAVDGLGNCYITGYFSGANVDFDPGAGTQPLTSAGSSSNDIFLAKYDASGNYMWAFKIGGTSADIGYGLAVDGADNCYITGTFTTASVDFNPGAGTQILSSTGSNDAFLAKYDASGNYVWAFKIGGSGNDIGYGVAVDASGNSYITGYFAGANVDFDPGAAAQTLSSTGIDIYQAAYDASGNYVWAKKVGSTSTDMGFALAIDGSGNSYTTGSFYNTVDFDPGAGTASLSAGASYANAFILQLNSTGDYVSAGRLGGYGNTSFPDQGAAIRVDASGNSYVTGNFSGTVDFDPGAGTQNLISAGGNDIFLAKYNASGNLVWAQNIGGTGDDAGAGLFLDASGNIYITGSFNGTVDFDPGAGTQPLASAGSTDIFLAKYDASGTYVWAKNMGGTGAEASYGLAVDASGNSYVTGYFNGTADFDPGAGTQPLVSIGSSDIFLAKYDASGNYTWAMRMGATNNDVGYALTVDGLNNVYITGYFSSIVDFDPGAGTQSLASNGGFDIFLAKYDAAGNYIWAKNMGGTTNEIGQALALDGSDNPYITGYFTGTADFDPDAGTTQNLSSAGSNDIFLAKYDASGNYLWAKGIGALNNDIGYALAIDASGNSYITGYFIGTIDFDPGAGTQNLSSAGGNDIFLASFDAAGNYLWAKSMGGSGGDYGYGLALDGAGNSYITGYFNAVADFDPGTGTQNLMSLNGNDIYIAQYGSGTPLPITLESFGGRLIDNGAAALLQWTTAMQEDLAYFAIERSNGGNNSTAIGRVTGCGTCNERQQYSFTDHQPLSSKSNYRLKMVDKNGKAAFSKWVSIRKNEDGGSLVLYPTITTGRVAVYYELTGTARKIRVSVFDARGILVQQKQAILANGSNQLNIDLAGQVPGVYYVQLAEQNGKILATGTAIRQ